MAGFRRPTASFVRAGLVFIRGGPLVILCAGDVGITEQLQRPLRGLNRFEQPGESDQFWLPHGELFRLLRRTGFDVEDLVELYAPDDAQQHEYYSFVTPEWARKWPSEEIWTARKAR